MAANRLEQTSIYFNGPQSVGKPADEYNGDWFYAAKAKHHRCDMWMALYGYNVSQRGQNLNFSAQFYHHPATHIKDSLYITYCLPYFGWD